MKYAKGELLQNHFLCKKTKADCYDRKEIALVDLLLEENRQLLTERINLSKRVDKLSELVLDIRILQAKFASLLEFGED